MGLSQSRVGSVWWNRGRAGDHPDLGSGRAIVTFSSRHFDLSGIRLADVSSCHTP